MAYDKEMAGLSPTENPAARKKTHQSDKRLAMALKTMVEWYIGDWKSGM